MPEPETPPVKTQPEAVVGNPPVAPASKIPVQTQPEVKTANYIFKDEVFMSRAREIQGFFEPFKGRANHNPYFELAKLDQILDRYNNKKERSKELMDELMAIKLVKPIINPNLPDEPAKQVEKQIVAPGLKLPAGATIKQ